VCVRPELSHKSADELRLEDYAANGAATLISSAASQPGAVDMGLRSFQQPFAAFAPQQPQQGTSLFGTNTVGLFPSTASPFGSTQQLTNSSFSTFPQQNVFQQPMKQQSAFNAFPVQQSAWGTATAGFGGGWGGAFQQPQQPQQQQQSSFASNTNSIFGQPQPSTVFSTLTNNAFTLPAQQTSFFAPQAPQQQQTSFFTPQQPPLAFGFNTGFGSAFGGAFGVQQSNFVQFQKPQQAEFFWSHSPVSCFSMFLSTLPPTIGSVSFGGVPVSLPSLEYCAQRREAEKCRLAKVDQDPYGLELIRPLDPVLDRPTLESTASAPGSTNSAANHSVTASPMQRGTSSPTGLITPSRSPLILPASHAHSHLRSESALHSSSLLALAGRSQTVCAALSHSPRLGPLPASPYLMDALTTSTGSPLIHARATSAHSTPTKNQAGRSVFHHAAHAPSSILFASQAEQLTSSPSRPIATPERRLDTMQQRENAWAARLVE
jgi:hypothetical protein